MGVLLKDQKTLYASQNLGKIDVSGGGGSTPDPGGDTTVAVTGVTITGNSTLPATASATIQLTATVSPSNATDKRVTWSSSNENLATVSNSGLVTRVAAVKHSQGGSGSKAVTIFATSVSDNTKMGTKIIDVAFEEYSTEDVYPDSYVRLDASTLIGAGNGILTDATGPYWRDVNNGRRNLYLNGDTTGGVLDTSNLIANTTDIKGLQCLASNFTNGALLEDGFDPTKGFTVAMLFWHNENVSAKYAPSGYTLSVSKDTDVLFGMYPNSMECDTPHNRPRFEMLIGKRPETPNGQNKIIIRMRRGAWNGGAITKVWQFETANIIFATGANGSYVPGPHVVIFRYAPNNGEGYAQISLSIDATFVDLKDSNNVSSRAPIVSHTDSIGTSGIIEAIDNLNPIFTIGSTCAATDDLNPYGGLKVKSASINNFYGVIGHVGIFENALSDNEIIAVSNIILSGESTAAKLAFVSSHNALVTAGGTALCELSSLSALTETLAALEAEEQEQTPA